MQNILKTLLVVTFIGFGALVFSAGADARFYKADSFAAAGMQISPKDLYVRNCTRCHGADGKGQTDSGQKLDVPDLSISGPRMSVAKISGIIKNGKDEMPAYGKKLTSKQIASIAAYVRKL